MKVLIDGKEYNLTPDGDGLVSVTFTKQDKSPISIGALEDCAGTTVIDNIQLEQADKATAYEDPALIQGEATGLIKDIRGLEYAINDPVNGLRSQLTILTQGFEAEVADAIGNYSVQGQTIDGLFSEIKSIDGNLNQLVRNAEGNNQLISSLKNDIEQNKLDYHSLKETADSYERIIGSSQAEFENNVSRAVQTSGLIQQEVASLTSGLSTTVSQLEDSWSLQLKDGTDLKTALNATTDGLRLKGDLIHLTGTTVVDGDFWAKEVNAIKVNADNILTGTIDASQISVINLDANNISGNATEFVQSIWNGLNNTIGIDTNGIRSTAVNGDWTLYHAGAISFGGSNKPGVYMEYADGNRNGLSILNRGSESDEISFDLMSRARNTLNFGRQTDTNGYDFRIDHYQGDRVVFQGRDISRYTFNLNSDNQAGSISMLGHGNNGYLGGSNYSIGYETADGALKGSRFYFSSASDLVFLSKNNFSDLQPLAVFDLQFRWGQSERKSLKTVLEYLLRAAGVDINNIPSI